MRKWLAILDGRVNPGAKGKESEMNQRVGVEYVKQRETIWKRGKWNKEVSNGFSF